MLFIAPRAKLTASSVQRRISRVKFLAFPIDLRVAALELATVGASEREERRKEGKSRLLRRKWHFNAHFPFSVERESRENSSYILRPPPSPPPLFLDVGLPAKEEGKKEHGD